MFQRILCKFEQIRTVSLLLLFFLLGFNIVIFYLVPLTSADIFSKVIVHWYQFLADFLQHYIIVYILFLIRGCMWGSSFSIVVLQ